MIYITHEKSIGRAGHQFKDAVTPLIIAEIFGFTFLYTQYKAIELFNLGEGRLTRTDLPEDISIHNVEGPYWRGVSYEKLISEFADLPMQYKDRDCLVVLKNSFRVQLFQAYTWHKEGLLQQNIYARVVNTLRNNFRIRNSQDRKQGTMHHKVTIAVHIRRGDVAEPKGRVPSSQHFAHSMEYYDGILKELRNHLNDYDLDIRIYTERSNADDVVDYCKASPDVVLHQGGKDEFAEHFSQMVYSDVLVVSNSSMSQMAGYLSEGLKIFHPNDQYHSLPELEFIPFNKLDQTAILRYLSRKKSDL